MYIYLIVFLLLTGYAVFFAPGAGGGDDVIFQSLIRGEFDHVDPLVTAVFSSLGVYPAIFLMLLVRLDRHRVPAWPFALLSFGLGAFAVLPWFVVRGKIVQDKPRGPDWLHQAVRSKILLSLLLVLSAGLWLTAFTGSIGAYAEAFQTSHLVSVMTVDLFVIFWLCFWIFRQEFDERLAPLGTFPLFGPLVLLWKTR